MTIDERVALLLDGFSPDERIRLRPPMWASEFLSLSVPSVYRLVAAGVLPHVKLPGAVRSNGRGRAGSIRFRLVDLARFVVEREVAVAVTAEPRRIVELGRAARRAAGGAS